MLKNLDLTNLINEYKCYKNKQINDCEKQRSVLRTIIN